MDMTYVITGATGEVGSRVVRLLLERGIRPRVLVRKEEKARVLFGDQVDVSVGDLASPDSIRAALQGAEGVFLVNVGPEIPERDKLAATLCKELRIRKIVKLSSLDLFTLKILLRCVSPPFFPMNTLGRRSQSPVLSLFRLQQQPTLLAKRSGGRFRIRL